MLHAPIVEGEGAPSSPIRLRVLSLGAGVQSTTLALMAAHGEVKPVPDCAVFADTGWEPTAVYAHLRWFMSGNVLPFPVHIVSAGNIRDNLMAATQGDRWASIPAFTRTLDRRGNISIGMVAGNVPATTRSIRSAERFVRSSGSPVGVRLRGIRGEVYLHRSAVALDTADLSTDADHGQLDLWPNECEGTCGL